MPAPRVIPVSASSGNYEVVVGPRLLAELGPRAARALGTLPRRALLVADRGVPQATIDLALTSLGSEGCSCAVALVNADERDKSLAAAERLLLAASAHALDRSDLVVALGGGLTGDLAGFVASTYMRGVNVIQCPTTLLAMVDASVGGKTGVNLPSPHGLLKNMAGTIHQPRLVLADLAALDCLPERQFRSGLAECLKHGLLAADFGDPGLWTWTLAGLPRIREPAILAELIERNVRIKAAVVGNDERELHPSAGRALLNLGHTFGHAIETLPGVTPEAPGGLVPPPSEPTPLLPAMLHGEAVAIGLHAAAVCAAACSPDTGPAALLVQDACAALHAAGLPARARGLPSDDVILDRMRHDKKMLGERLRIILPVPGGRSKVRLDVPEVALRKALRAIRAEET